jgi:hypothetical protein
VTGDWQSILHFIKQFILINTKKIEIFVYGAMLIRYIPKDPGVYEQCCEDLKFHSEIEIWI